MAKFESYPFKNISKIDFVGKYDGEDYLVLAGETRMFPVFIVNGLVSQWLDWAVNSEEFGIKKADGTFDKPEFIKSKRMILEAEIRVIPPVVPQEAPKVMPEATPKDFGVKVEPKTEEVKQTEFKCEKCGKIAKSKIGLISHMRTHK